MTTTRTNWCTRSPASRSASRSTPRGRTTAVERRSGVKCAAIASTSPAEPGLCALERVAQGIERKTATRRPRLEGWLDGDRDRVPAGGSSALNGSAATVEPAELRLNAVFTVIV